MADDNTSGSSSLRLAAPSHQAYDTSVGEASVLRGITPETMGAMYGMLLNQRTLGANAQDRYQRTLGAVNEQQDRLNRLKMMQDDLKNRRSTAIDAIRYGGQTYGNMIDLRDMANDPRITAQNDQILSQGRQAETLKNFGAGVDSLDQAGIRMPNGTPLGRLDPQRIAELAVNGPSRQERVQMLDNVGRIGAASAGNSAGRDIVTVNEGPIPALNGLRFQSPTIERLNAQRAKAGYPPVSPATMGATASPGQPAGGPAPPAPTGTGGGTRTGGIASGEQAAAVIRSLNLPTGTRPFQNRETGEWVARLPGGAGEIKLSR